MLEDTVEFVIGSSQGMGREIAITLANHGADIALAARSGGIYETAEMIKDSVRTYPVETDVTDESSVETAIEATVDELGALDCLVNNAGIAGPTTPIQDIDISERQRVQNVNVVGTFLCTKYTVPYLIESDRASVIAIASFSAKVPHPLRTPYTASNAAQITTMQAVAYELGQDGVTANTISPGPVKGDRLQRVWEAQAEREGISVEEVRREAETSLPIDEIIAVDRFRHVARNIVFAQPLVRLIGT